MSKQWEIGDISLIDNEPHQVKEIKDGKVFLRKLTGRKIIEMLPDEIPYFDENNKLITPKRADWSKMPIDTKINISKLLKSNTDLQVSKPFMAFVKENIETIILNLLDEAETLALLQNKKRLEPAHWYWLELPFPMNNTYNDKQNEYAKESVRYCAK
jgi:histone H3/H4|tara:strand:- start:6239 stop:6709 length:471 start_codon:yes stop_codon:yes gene_type:complete